MDPFKTLLLDSPTVLASDGTGLLQASNNLSDVDDVATSRDNLQVLSSAQSGALSADIGGRGYAISDGATSNRAEILAPGTIGAVAGLPMTILAEFTVPASNPSTAAYFTLIGSSASASAPWSFLAAISATGELILRQEGAVGPGVDFRRFGWTGFRAAYSGQDVRLSINFTEGNSTTAPVIRVNGTDISSSFSLTTGGTAPNWMDASLVSTFFSNGLTWPSGRVPYVRAVIGSFSTAESQAWGKYGTMPVWATRSGTAVVQTSGTLTIGRRYYIKSYVASDDFTNVGAGSNATAVSFTATGTTPTTWTNSSQLVPLGPIDAHSYQPALATFDRFGRMSRRLLGFTPVSNSDTFTIIGNTSTSGNEQLLGGAVLSSANDVTFDQLEQATATGTPTTSVGSASGGAQYKASAAIAAGLNVFTPVTRKPASTSVWVASNDTTNVRTIVHGHKVSVPVS